jgi:purine nucleoside phosphorylase I, inosine and guanosine-specific
MSTYIEQINEATNYISQYLNKPLDIAIILGSGLGPLANEVENPVVIDYKDIPHFPVSTIPGHEGKLYIGTINKKQVVVMKGRFHYYEGYDMSIVTLPIRVFKKLGITQLLVTNACGGIREDLNPGTISLISDHISFLCPSPLRGPNLEEFGPRFKDMSEVYSRKLRTLAKDIAVSLNIDVKESIYAYFKGPMFETPAEIQALKAIGADTVGMSTVAEATVARHSGMTTLGISLITNKAAGISDNELNHEEVMEAAALAEKNLVKLVKEIIKEWPID